MKKKGIDFMRKKDLTFRYCDEVFGIDNIVIELNNIVFEYLDRLADIEVNYRDCEYYNDFIWSLKFEIFLIQKAIEYLCNLNNKSIKYFTSKGLGFGKPHIVE